MSTLQSDFEIQKIAKQQKIKRLEKKIVKKRPWQLLGEVSAKDRPENSVLENFLEFDVKTKPAPAITKEFEDQLEKMIKIKILNNDFNDNVIQNTEATINDAIVESKTMPDLSTEKSKMGLSELYEQKYINTLKTKQNLANGEFNNSNAEEQNLAELSDEQKQVLTLFSNLSHSLNSLSNFHFTPKPPRKEWEIKAPIVPALSVEEKLPATSVSSAFILDGSLGVPSQLRQSDSRRTESAKKEINEFDSKDYDKTTSSKKRLEGIKEQMESFNKEDEEIFKEVVRKSTKAPEETLGVGVKIKLNDDVDTQRKHGLENRKNKRKNKRSHKSRRDDD